MAQAHSQDNKHTNRLAQETSPYLLQHAHNPVEWYPWGEEAIERARRENRPIFLSVGYSTCYWCHVMERQSFENEMIAKEMNERFVNIKVDREERPDVDQLYMTAVQVLTRHGGWPMSVWLTPDLRPFYGGTYFPPTDAHGRPGFVTVVRAIEAAYRERPDEVEKTATQLVSILKQLAEPGAPEEPVTIDKRFVEELVERSTSDYERNFGGFGHAPKFPRQTLLEMLLVHLKRFPNDNRAKMVRHALDAMAHGGIRDQLGGGFHRYSTDARWLVPHFEIMLYDNAMLGVVYSEACEQFGEARYGQVARGIFDYVLREMTSPEGAFYTAFDAEVDAQEGLSYLWTAAEIAEVLGVEDARLFGRAYGVDRGPNFEDPHHGTGKAEKNILYLPEPLEALAKKVGMSEEQLEARLATMRHKLYGVRAKRKQPLLDTKIITSWDALMIRAMAYGGRVLGEKRYVDAAVKAAEYLLAVHRREDGSFWRTSRDGVTKHDAFLDDYAFLAQALLELGRATGEKRWRQEAATVAARMQVLFGDGDRGGFYFTAAGARDLIVRQKVATDSPLPSGNAVAAMVMLQLGQVDVGRDVLRVFAKQLEQNGEGMSSLVQAAIEYLKDHEAVTVSPGPWRGSEGGEMTAAESPSDAARDAVEVEGQWITPTQLHLSLTIAQGYHVNAHEAGEGLIPTSVVIGGGVGEDVEAVEYPAGESRQYSYADEAIRVYEGRVTIPIRFRRPMIGVGAVRVVVTYQACTEESCLPVVNRQIEI